MPIGFAKREQPFNRGESAEHVSCASDRLIHRLQFKNTTQDLFVVVFKWCVYSGYCDILL